MTLLLILILISFLLCSAFFSSSEVALFSLSSMKVKTFRTDKDPRKQLVAKLLASPRDLLTTMIMFNVMVNILIQNVTSSIFGDFAGWGFSVALPLVLTLVFGEALPKSIGMANNAKISYRVAPFLNAAQTFFLPIRRVLTALTHVISRCLFFFLRKEKEISTDELQHALKTSKSYGILHEDEAELVRGYLNLQEAQVKDLMRPREEVLFFDIEDPLSKLVHLFVDQKCSRLPVVKDNLDNVLGMISAQSYFLHKESVKAPFDLNALLTKPLFIPEGMSAEGALRKFYERQEPLALVVDEYGSISGLITVEDLVERVVGKISDARDEMSRYTKSSEDVIIASGKMELAEFEELFNVALYSENHMVTIGGFLTEKIGEIPKAGTKYTFEGFLFHILSSDLKRIRRIYIRRLKSSLPLKKRRRR